MTVAYLSLIRDEEEGTKDQENTTTDVVSRGPLRRKKRRFQCVDSVVCDIDAQWETRSFAN